jgi:hypothetical protein
MSQAGPLLLPPPNFSGVGLLFLFRFLVSFVAFFEAPESWGVMLLLLLCFAF